MFGQVRYKDGFLDHLTVIKSVFSCSSCFSSPKWKTSCSQPELFFQEIFKVEKRPVGRARFFILVLELEMGRYTSENHPAYRNNVIVLLLWLNLLSPYHVACMFLFKVLPEKCWVYAVFVHFYSILTDEHSDCHEVVLKSKCNKGIY